MKVCAKCTAFTTAKLAFSLKRVSRSQSRSLSYKIRSGDTFSAVSQNRVRGTSRAHGPGSSDPEARGRAPLARDVSRAVSGLAWGSPAGQMPRKPELRAAAVTTTETSERWPGRTSLAVSTSQTRKCPVCDPSPGSKDCGPLPLGGLRVCRGAKPTGDGPALSARVRQRP